MDPNPLTEAPGGNVQAPATAWSGQEVAFRRRFAGILTRRSQWLSHGILALMAAFAAMYLLSDPAPAQPHPQRSTGMNGNLVIVPCIAIVIYYLLSRGYERLYLGHTGIRYASWLGGPAAFLSSLYPSWELRWDELADIRLEKRNQGRGGIAWYYVVTPKAA